MLYENGVLTHFGNNNIFFIVLFAGNLLSSTQQILRESIMAAFGHFGEKYKIQNCNQKHLQNVKIIVRNYLLWLLWGV